MRVIRETKNIGSDVYERTVGATCNLHEFMEAAEFANEFQLNDADGDEYYLPSVVEYEVFVNGKAVDPSKIKISVYDGPEHRTDYWYCEATNSEMETSELEEASDLAKMSKEELIRKVFELQGR